MRAPDPKSLFSEPVRIGIISGFAALSVAAVVQLMMDYIAGQSTAPDMASLVTSLLAATAAGTCAAVASMRFVQRNNRELQLAASLAKGDFSSCILPGDNAETSMARALSAIAERELARETEQAKLTKDASLRQDQLSDALDAIPHEVAIYNRNGILVGVNRAFLSHCNEIGAVVALGMTAYDVVASMAKAPGANLPLNERQTWINQQDAQRREALETAQPLRFARAAGTCLELIVTVSPEGNRTEIVRDMTAFAELEQRAQRSHRETVAAESIKQITLSRISHTIRTPMNGVLAATELLAQTQLDQTQKDRLDIIRRSASTLLGVVQDMFDMAATKPDEEAVLEPEPIHRSALVLELPGQPLEKTVASLVEGGFEVGRAESITLLAETIKVLAGQNRLPNLVKVPDFASRDQLFARLGGVDRACNLKVEVTTSQDMDVKEPGQLAGAAAMHSLEVVIAESDEVSRIAYTNSFAASGITVRIVGTGKEAVALSRSHAPKLIVLDMTLPDMDGLATASAIRKTNGGKPGLGKLVAMTSHFVNGDMAKCLANGMDSYVLKPSVGPEMVSLISELLDGAEMKKAG